MEGKQDDGVGLCEGGKGRQHGEHLKQGPAWRAQGSLWVGAGGSVMHR